MFLFRRFSVLLIISAVGACGGGGGAGSVGGSFGMADTGVGGSGGGTTTSFGFQDTGVGGSGGAVGPVQDFGSIIVNELKLNIDSAAFDIEGQPAGIGREGQGRLKEGQQVVVPYDVSSFDGLEYEAVEVFYRSNVKGPLTGINVIDNTSGSADLVVLGQSVRTNGVTRFSGGAALDSLAFGDEVEVSGAANADGVLVATFIELKATKAAADAGDGLVEYKVVGSVTNVDGAFFEVGGLKVDYATTGFDASNGQEVEVKIDAEDYDPAVPDTAKAREIEGLPELRVESSAEVEFEGFITAFSDTADANVKNFVLNGVPVATNGNTVYEDGGSVENLANNVKIEVEGTVNAEGTLVAEKIELESTNAVRAESTIAGLTPDPGNPNTGTLVTAVGLRFRVSDIAEMEDDRDGVEPLSLDDLQIGDYIEVRGFVDGDVIKAVELDRDNVRDDHRLRAPIIDTPARSGGGGSLVLLGDIAVEVTDAVTRFRDASGDPVATLADFFALLDVGTVVEARWDVFTSNAATADELAIEGND